VYSPCRLFWMVFDGKEVASANARLFPSGEIEALFELASCQNAPIVLPETCIQDLSVLCGQLTDERLLIGSALIMADVRSKIYSSVIEMWKTGASGGDQRHSQLVRKAVRLLRDTADGSADDDHDEKIEDIARQLGYGKSRLYDLFGREVGMAPNDYRQRVRIKRCCQSLVQTDESITSIGISSGFGSSQYFARVFKKYVGVTPTAYRQLFGRGPVPQVAREIR
jgi:AraC-like DNA-binding protein